MNDNSRYPGRGGPGLRLSRRAALPLLLAAVALIALGQASGAQTVSLFYSFAGAPSDGQNPRGSLIQAADGNFYGMTTYGGANSKGTVFEITPSGTETMLHSFGGTVLDSLGNSVSDGANPWGNLIQGRDGSLYGMTYAGGSSGYGTVFEIPNAGTPSAPVWGTFTLLHSFAGGTNDGRNPRGSLIQAIDGSLYGMTLYGGSGNYGMVFEIPNTGTPSAPVWGTETMLYAFTNGNDGATPYGSLIQAADGNLYGMTYAGGSSGYGTVFEIPNTGTPSAPVWGTTLTILYTFTGYDDGAQPFGSLIQAADGSLYGMNSQGGDGNYGTVFKIPNTGTPSAPVWGTTLTTLYAFTGGSDGANPYSSLIRASDGNLYGATPSGGTLAGGNGYGTVFGISNLAATTPTFTVIHAFAGGSSDGRGSFGSLIQAADGKLYGMTLSGGAYGGANGYGTIFACGASVSGQLSTSPAASGWYNAGTGMPTLNITGIYTNSITYTVTQNGAAGSPVTVPGTSATITFPGDGVYSVAYYGTGVLGDQSSTQATAANIDTTPPVTYLYNADSLVFLDPTDNASGVAVTYYTVDSGAQQTYVDEIQLTPDTTHTITYWSVDVAGNVEAVNAATVDTRDTTFVLANDVPGITTVLGPTAFSATLTQTDTNLPVSGQTLTFTLFNGASLGTATTNSSGVATVKAQLPLSATAGSHTFTASFAGDSTQKPSSDMGNVTIGAVSTTLAATSRGSAGAPIPVGTLINPLKAELTANGANIPLSGCTINYQMNGSSIGSAVTSGNIAGISYTLPDTLPMGANTLTVSFAGQGSLSASTGTATYYIGPANTTMTPAYRSGAMGTLLALSATLTSQITHLGVAGKTITFTVKGQTYTATTSVNGIATVFITLPSTKGTFTYTASFAGTSNYNASSNIGYIIVTN